jgi:hypothetical protein
VLANVFLHSKIEQALGHLVAALVFLIKKVKSRHYYQIEI